LEALFTPFNFVDGWDALHEPSRWLSLYDTLLTEPLTPRIAAWRVKTPAHYEKEFFLPQGHATSFSGGPVSIFLSQQPELSRYATPIKNLYITGAATFPGAGIWGSSGRNAAQVVLNNH
jgi:phytoene dehydrogenase-like protein